MFAEYNCIGLGLVILGDVVVVGCSEMAGCFPNFGGGWRQGWSCRPVGSVGHSGHPIVWMVAAYFECMGDFVIVQFVHICFHSFPARCGLSLQWGREDYFDFVCMLFVPVVGGWLSPPLLFDLVTVEVQ